VNPPSPSPRRAGRPRGSTGGQTRSQALTAAMELFAETGFRGTSLQRVAEQVGLSQAGLLHHFGSKNQLLADVLQRRDDLDAAYLSQGEVPGGWQVFEDFIEVVRRNTTTPGLVRLYVTLSGEAVDPDHPGHAWLAGHYQAVVSRLAQALRAGIADGTVRPETPCETVARSVTALMDGLQLQWLMDPESVDMIEAVSDFVVALRCRWELK
jgi:AcrR family transcriptional regulator